MSLEDALEYAKSQLFQPHSTLFKTLESWRSGASRVGEDINGVGIGIDAQRNQPNLTVLLKRNSPHPYQSMLAQSLARGAGGVPVAPIVVGEFQSIRPIAPSTNSRRQRVRPPPGGVSIGHHQITAGTLGCIVQASDGQPYILSNNHVLANSNYTNQYESVYQPGPYDGGNPGDEIATVDRWVPLDPSRVNYVDAALARPTSQVRTDVMDIGQIPGSAKATLGIRVWKSGRTTGVTQGRVTILRAYIQVNYPSLGALTFDDQIIIEPGAFSRGGDSGSLIVDENKQAVGLLFAGSELYTLANPIEYIYSNLRVAAIL